MFAYESERVCHSVIWHQTVAEYGEQRDQIMYMPEEQERERERERETWKDL